MFTALELATENYADTIDRTLGIIDSGSEDPEAYFLVAWSWRVFGLCHLLGTADVEPFVDCLRRSAQARLAFLEKVRDGLTCEPAYRCASKNIAFTAAVAAGDMRTAREIAMRSPTSHIASVEYEDDFLFFHLMHRLSVAPDDVAGHTAILARWKDVLEGGESGQLAACHAIVTRDSDEFAAGFDALLGEHQERLAKYRESPTFDAELFAAEGRVYVEAIAVLRFAELHGLPTKREYPLVPSIARVPLVDTPLEPGAWRRRPA
ncbi:MAG TPA: hypothetical protein VM076_23110 [Gemmatimonadaceae bacterium]|nr:hypothetical protein [Gemmatimonadaceae bacterium]